MSDLYSRWYYKIAEFGGMKITHRAGRKLYCADALSRRRVNENEDLAPFFVEPGELFRTMARPAGSSSLQDELEPRSDQSQLHIQLVRDESRQFTLKVSSATEHSQAATIIYWLSPLWVINVIIIIDNRSRPAVRFIIRVSQVHVGFCIHTAGEA
jgi:hypothetical protein